jgi:hypothetical protein
VLAFLTALTTIVNGLSLSGSLWLGVYIVTRGSRRLRSWLAALTLWFLALFFLRNLLLIYLPGNVLLFRVRLLAMLGLTFWFHLILLLVPDGRGRLGPLPLTFRVQRGLLLLAYGLGAFLVLQQFLSTAPPPEPDWAPVTILGRASRSSSPLVAVNILALGSVSFALLWQLWSRSRDLWLRRFIAALVATTTPAIAAGLYLAVGPWLYPALPAVPADAVLGVCVILLGYNVARYDALIEGRTIHRDALYSLAGAGLALGLYGILGLALVLAGQASFLAILLVLIAVIVTHAVYDGSRTALDRLFYRGQSRQLRANLRALAGEAGAGQALAEQFPATLAALCRALHAGYGFLALWQDQAYVIRASVKADHAGRVLAAADLNAAELAPWPRLGSAGPEAPGVIAPLWAGGAQLGALVLGPKASAQSYSDADLDLLDDVADRIAALLHAWRLQQDTAANLNHMVAEFRQRERALQRQVQQLLAERELPPPPAAGALDDGDFAGLVEASLRRLGDYSFLGEHPLAGLRAVTARLGAPAGQVVTHIDRGKALHALLLEALEKLKPPGRDPGAVRAPAREWHPYLSLYDAYVLKRPTRDIMLQVNISEPTFHRTRRRAIRGVAKALREMEQAVPADG